MLGRSIPLIELFEYPTVEALAAHLGGTPRRARRTRRRVHGRSRGGERPIRASRSRSSAWRAGSPARPTSPRSGRTCAAASNRSAFFTDDELRRGGVDERLIDDPRYVKARGVLDGVDLFDAAFFGFTPREAELIDPQQRLFLECAARRSSTRATIPIAIDGPIGVYAGANLSTLPC